MADPEPAGAPPSKKQRQGGKASSAALEKGDNVSASTLNGADTPARGNESAASPTKPAATTLLKACPTESLARLLQVAETTELLGAIAEYAGIKDTLLGFSMSCCAMNKAVRTLMKKVKSCTSKESFGVNLAQSWWLSLAAGRFPMDVDNSRAKDCDTGDLFPCESVREVFRRMKLVIKRRTKSLGCLYEKKYDKAEKKGLKLEDELAWFISGSPMSQDDVEAAVESEIQRVKYNPRSSSEKKWSQLLQDDKMKLTLPPDAMNFLVSFGKDLEAAEMGYADSCGCKGMFPVNSLTAFSLGGDFIPDQKDIANLFELDFNNEDSTKALLILAFAEVNDTEDIHGGRLGVVVHPPQLRGEIWFKWPDMTWRYLAPDACSWVLEIRPGNTLCC